MFLPIVWKDKPSPNSEIRFHLVCCTVLTKSALPIRIKKLVKKVMQHHRNVLCLECVCSISRRLNKITKSDYWLRCVCPSVRRELRYKPEGCGFDSRLCNWNFSLT